MREGHCEIRLENLTPLQARIATVLWYDCDTRQQVDAALRIWGPAAVEVQRMILEARYKTLVNRSLDVIRVQEDLEPRVEVSLADAQKVIDKFMR